MVLHEDGRSVGHNTDAAAFLADLREGAGFDPEGTTALLLGAGGAARAVAWALAGAGARVEASARRAPAAAALPGVAGTRAWGPDLALSGVDLLVNCTPLGMAGTEGPADPWGSLLAWDGLPRDALVMDLVYTPEVTPLLAAARARGHVTRGGLGMLVRQAEASFTLWTGRPAPAGAMLRAARAPSN